MAKTLLMALAIILVLGCRKLPFSDDDTTFYQWKRDLYRAPVQKDEPAIFASRDGKLGRNETPVFLNSDVVILTEYRKDKQQDSMYRASGKMMVYKYEKLDIAR